MKISFAPTERGMQSQRTAINNLTPCIARVWVDEDSPNFAGENIDALIRYADEGRDGIVLRGWDRESEVPTTSDTLVYATRIHVY